MDLTTVLGLAFHYQSTSVSSVFMHGIYTVGHKKRGSKFFATTFANIDRFKNNVCIKLTLNE